MKASSSNAGASKMAYMEIYEATYSIGDITEQGQRVWLDGVIILYTFNHKIYLRGERGIEIAKGFYLPRSPASPKVKADENGRYVSTLQRGKKYQLFDDYTVEIDSLRSYQERPIDAVALREQARITKDAKIPEWTKEQLKKAKDILPAELKKPLARDASESERGEKSDSVSLMESDLNALDSNSKKRRHLSDSTNKYEALSDTSSKASASTNRCRISGLSKRQR